jgi:iron complex transport system substrate-binding protein
MPGPRIVSLIASATEIVAALGARELLVGRSHECDFPPEVAALPALSRPRIAIDQPSGAIDDDIKALLEAALSIYEIDAERLRALAPDVVITQTLCRVCAVSLDDVTAALAAWTGARPQIVALAPLRLADVMADIARVGAAIGRVAAAAALIESMMGRIVAILQACAGLKRPRVAALEWIDPLMAGGNWMPELIAAAGGVAALGEAGAHSPPIDLAALQAADPDDILVVPCGFTITRTRAELPALAATPEWRALRAVREGRVYLLDGNALFNRPGPRLVESCEVLAEILHPERFRAGISYPGARAGAFALCHEGHFWERADSAAASA